MLQGQARAWPWPLGGFAVSFQSTDTISPPGVGGNVTLVKWDHLAETALSNRALGWVLLGLFPPLLFLYFCFHFAIPSFISASFLCLHFCLQGLLFF